MAQVILILLSIVLGNTPDAERYEALEAGDLAPIERLAEDNGWTFYEDGTIAPLD